MKKLSKIAIAAFALALSSAAMADDDISITAAGNSISQTQSGYYNDQDLKLGIVSIDALKNMTGDIDINASYNRISQYQTGRSNEQTMSIATVGCDC